MVTSVGLVSYVLADVGTRGELLTKQSPHIYGQSVAEHKDAVLLEYREKRYLKFALCHLLKTNVSFSLLYISFFPHL